MIKAFWVAVAIVALVGVSCYVMRGEKSMNKKILFVLMPKGYQDLEFNTPYSMLTNDGCTADVAGLAAGTAKGALGGGFTPNKLLSEMSNSDFDEYDALVIPGGPGSIDYLWNNASLTQVIQYFYKNKKLIASICHATAAVAKSGVLKNKKATGFPSKELKEVFKQEGVEFIDSGCFVDETNKMITAQSPRYADEFGKAIIKTLK